MNEYREGKVKRTANSGVKESLKLHANKQWELSAGFAGSSDRVLFEE